MYSQRCSPTWLSRSFNQPSLQPAPTPSYHPPPPITLPPGVCALPLSLSDVALRACARDIDANHSLNISLCTPACMELLTSALLGIPALDSLHITVSFGVRDESPYRHMLRAVCAMPRLFLLQLTDTTVMDQHILSLAAEVHGGMPLEELRMEVAQETAEAGGGVHRGSRRAAAAAVAELHGGLPVGGRLHAAS
eukprot:jgi/Ulvmu1/6300/UM029_0007.1